MSLTHDFNVEPVELAGPAPGSFALAVQVKTLEAHNRALTAALTEVASDARRELRFASPGPVRDAFLSIRATAEAALNAWGK